VGYEAQPWRMADALRGSMDAAEYKHIVLGLIFLKFISDAFVADLSIYFDREYFVSSSVQ
jgi:type I restriction-modification system DNA methylase subunit